MLNKIVRLKEDYGEMKAGAIGLCTADIQMKEDEYIFAVKYENTWITFKEKDSSIKDKFECVEN